jgi:hypothetical protein
MTAIIAPHASGIGLDENQVACVDALKEALAQALEGNVDSMAVVLCMKGGWATHIAGNRPGDLNLGCDDLKGKILDAVVNSPKTKAVSRIVRAGRA